MDLEEAEASKGNFDADVAAKCQQLNKSVLDIEARLEATHGYVVPKHYEVTRQLDYAIKSLNNTIILWDKALKG